jgi:hypothetical protein
MRTTQNGVMSNELTPKTQRYVLDAGPFQTTFAPSMDHIPPPSLAVMDPCAKRFKAADSLLEEDAPDRLRMVGSQGEVRKVTFTQTITASDTVSFNPGVVPSSVPEGKEQGATLDSLPNAIFRQHILPFVGDGQYRFIGSINKKYQALYRRVCTKPFTYWNTSTIPLTRLCWNELSFQRNPALLCVVAARQGHLQSLQYLKFTLQAEWDACVTAAAAAAGHRHILEWACYHGCPVDARSHVQAARHGHVHILQWLYDTTLWATGATPLWSWTDLCAFAAWHGHLAVVQWIHHHAPPTTTTSACVWAYSEMTNTTSICSSAARNGHFHIVQWARQHGADWDEKTCANAAAEGHFKLLQWIRNHGAPWDESTCSSAARYGHLSILQWAREQGCPWDEETCSNAAESGHLELLQWARANGCPWDENTCTYAAGGGHLAVLQWAHRHGCPWHGDTCGEAARCGQLRELQWAFQNGCSWNDDICVEAAGNGHLHVIQWLYENGCPLHKDICLEASRHGHLHVLQWACGRNGCPFQEVICLEACRKGHLDILIWARNQGCPWDPQVCRIVALDGYLKALDHRRQLGSIRNKCDCCREEEEDVLERDVPGDYLNILQWL